MTFVINAATCSNCGLPSDECDCTHNEFICNHPADGDKPTPLGMPDWEAIYNEEMERPVKSGRATQQRNSGPTPLPQIDWEAVYNEQAKS